MENLETILKEHAFFKGLSEEHIKFVVGCAGNERFNPGDFLFKEGQAASTFYLIRQGSISLEIYTPDKGPITIQTIGEGEIVGWSWIVSPYKWRFDARALELTRAIGMDGKCMRDKCETDHDLGYELLKRFSSITDQRLVATKLQLMDLYGKDK